MTRASDLRRKAATVARKAADLRALANDRGAHGYDSRKPPPDAKKGGKRGL